MIFIIDNREVQLRDEFYKRGAHQIQFKLESEEDKSGDTITQRAATPV